MAKGFRFMPLCLVRLRTFSAQCMGYLGATLTQVFAHARAERTCHSEMSQKPTLEADASECERRHAPEARGGVREISEKVRELKLDIERDGWLSRARWGETNLRATGAARDGSQMKKQA